MLYWIRYPGIRIACAFAAGIYFQHFAGVPPALLWMLAASAILVYLWCLKSYRKARFFRFNLLLCGLSLLSVFLLGSCCTILRDPVRSQLHLCKLPEDYQAYVFQVEELPVRSGNYLRFHAEVIMILRQERWQKAEGLIQIYLMDTTCQPRYGNVIMARGRPEQISVPSNPDEFNYARYLGNKGIYFRHFLLPDQHVLVGQVSGLSLKGLALAARARISSIIIHHFQDTDTRGIMLALLTGQRSFMEKETYDKFIRSGIVHTLAVSGLHVGIIYLFLLTVLKPFHRHPVSRKVSYGMKIMLLFFFAFMTGLSPSVLRATLMFSMMAVGKILNRNAPVLNVIFLSAFLLLCINPYLIFEVGFQLSYSAVTAIILFQPMVYGWIQSKNPVLDWMAKLCSVSISAQVGTLPLTLFYFHQFPTYFLLGNIIAIPYVSCSIVCGIAVIIFAPIPFLSTFMAFLIHHISRWFLHLIHLIQSLPAGIIRPIQMNALQALLLLIAIYSIFFSIQKRKHRMIYLFLAFFACILVIDFRDHYRYERQKKIMVYDVPGLTCIELVDGRNGIMLLEDMDTGNLQKIHYYTGNHIMKERRETRKMAMQDVLLHLPGTQVGGSLVFTWNGKSVAIVNAVTDTGAPFTDPAARITYPGLRISYPGSRISDPGSRIMDYKTLKDLPVDYLIIRNGKIRPETSVVKDHRARRLIWDASNHYVDPVVGMKENGYIGHHVRLQGPFVERLE